MYNHQPSIPHASYHHQPMANHGIHGNVLEVNVVCCYKLKDTEWISRQDPYVCVEYGNNRSRTRTNTDGGKNPIFQEKFVYIMIEGLRELNVMVWNSNTLSHDDFIGSGKVQLAKVISHGFDDSTWPLQSKTGRHAGEVRLIMHYTNANNHANSYATSVPPYVASGPPQVPMYSAPPPPAPATPSSMSFPPQYPPAGAYPAPPAAYSYPPNSGGYPPSPYPFPADPYPPRPYGPHYPAYPGGYPPPY